VSTVFHSKFQESPGTAVEALISINNQLRQPEAAIGVLTVAQQTLNVDLKVRAWLIRSSLTARFLLADNICAGPLH